LTIRQFCVILVVIVAKQRGRSEMRVLSQSEIDNILAELLANPSVLPGDAEKAKPESNENKPVNS
jgi:hypothetical protein